MVSLSARRHKKAMKIVHKRQVLGYRALTKVWYSYPDDSSVLCGFWYTFYHPETALYVYISSRKWSLECFVIVKHIYNTAVNSELYFFYFYMIKIT